MEPIFITALHRPFNQQLKAARWVCNFVDNAKAPVSSSGLNVNFFYYLINFLHKNYNIYTPEEFNGLPSKAAVDSVHAYIQGRGKKNFIAELPNVLKSRNTAVERQIYSSYKAASYFVNMAKDKFGLINDKNKLTAHGSQLLGFRAPVFKLSIAEKEFFFRRILDADFHLFITHCLFAKLEKKYHLKKSVDEQLEFIDKFLDIRHFNFTSASLENYNIVRDFWAESLGVIDKQAGIRRKYMSVIQGDSLYQKEYVELSALFGKFERENFRAKSNYLKKKEEFLSAYHKIIKSNINDLGFVNLYDIKEKMHISFERFQEFLTSFYEQEKSSINIFFNNNVNSIDRRERFLIRKRPVIKVKIK